MYEPCLVQQAQTIQQLLRKDSYERRAETSKLVLLDQLVQIHTQ